MTKKQSELFEGGEDEIVEAPPVEETPPVEEKPAKKPRKKRVLNEEQKQKLREQLARGRQKSIETRRRNRQLKDMEKEKQKEEQDKELFEHLKKKATKDEDGRKKINDDNLALRKRLEEMESKLLSLSSQSKKELPPIKEENEVVEEVAPPKKKIIENGTKIEKIDRKFIENGRDSAKKEGRVSAKKSEEKPKKIHASILPNGVSLEQLRFL